MDIKCEGCGKKLAMPFTQSEGWAFQIMDNSGSRCWCAACIKTVPEVVSKLEEIERMRQSLRYVPKKDENMATISKEIRLTLDECKEGIKLFLKERMGVDVHPSDIVFDAVYTSGGHGDNGPPKTTGCTIRFKDEKL